MNPCFQPSPFALVCATVTARDLVCATVSDSQVNFTDSACLCCCVWQPGELYWFRLSVLLCPTARCSCLHNCVWQPGLLSVLLWQPGLLFVLLCLTARWTLLILPVCATVPDSQMLLSVLLWQPGLLSVLLCLCATVSDSQVLLSVLLCLTARAPVCATVSDNQVLLSVLLCLTARALVCVTVSNSQVTLLIPPVCVTVSNSQVNFTDSTCLWYCVWQPGELYWFHLSVLLCLIAR